MSAKLFDGHTPRLCVDQYGRTIRAATLKELRQKCGSGSAPAKQYRDVRQGPNAGKTMWTGYVIGYYWFTIYAPLEVEASL